MRLTFVLSSLRLSGGVILVVELANRLAARGHQVTLLAPWNTLDHEIGGRIHQKVQVRFADVGIPAPWNLPGLLLLIFSLVRHVPPGDVLVATHTPTTLPVLLASRWKQQQRLWLYMDYPEMFERRPPERILFAMAPSWFSAIVAISGPLAKEVASRATGKVYVIRPGLGLDIDVPGEELGYGKPGLDRTRHEWRILYVGDDRPRKGLKEFLQAMEKVYSFVPSVRAVIVCKHPCRVETSVPYELHVRPNDRELAKLYLCCDIFVSTSWAEGLGYPVLQAMAFGMPTVVAESGGTRDYAEDGVNAIVVPGQDSEAVARGIQRLMDDPWLRSRLSRNGQSTAARYNWERATDAFEEHLTEVINARGR